MLGNLMMQLIFMIKHWRKILEISMHWRALLMPLENLETTKEHWSVNDEALDIDNEDAELWFNRGEVLKELKRYDDSLDSFNKALNARTRL
jgi:tetratricopeptide (TPR) repeat protein